MEGDVAGDLQAGSLDPPSDNPQRVQISVEDYIQWLQGQDSTENVPLLIQKLRDSKGDDEPCHRIICDAVEACLKNAASHNVKIEILTDWNHEINIDKDIPADSAIQLSMDTDTVVLVMDTLEFLARLQLLPRLPNNWAVRRPERRARWALLRNTNGSQLKVVTSTPPNRSSRVRASHQRRRDRARLRNTSGESSDQTFADWDGNRPPQEYIGTVGANGAVYLLQRHFPSLSHQHHRDAFRLMVKYFTWCRQRIDLSGDISLPSALSSGVHVASSMCEAVAHGAPVHTQAYPVAGKQQIDTIMRRFRSVSLRNAFLESAKDELHSVWLQRTPGAADVGTTSVDIDLDWNTHWHLTKNAARKMIENPLFHVMIQMQRHGVASITRPAAEVPNEEGLLHPAQQASEEVISQIFGSILRPFDGTEARNRPGEMTAFFSLGLEALLVKRVPSQTIHECDQMSGGAELGSETIASEMETVLYSEHFNGSESVPLQVHLLGNKFQEALAETIQAGESRHFVGIGGAFNTFPKYGDLRPHAASPIAIQMAHNCSYKINHVSNKNAGCGLAGLVDVVKTGGRELSPVLTIYETASKRPYSKQSILQDGQSSFLRSLGMVGAAEGAHSEKAAKILSMLVGRKNSLMGQLESSMSATERPYPLRIELIIPVHIEGNVDVVKACSDGLTEGFVRLLRVRLPGLCGVSRADAYPTMMSQYIKGIIHIVSQHVNDEIMSTGMVSMETLTNAVGLLGSVTSVLDNPRDTFRPFQEVMQRSGWWRTFARESGCFRPHPYMLAPGRSLSLVEGFMKSQKVDIWGWDMPPGLRLIFRAFRDSYRVHGVRATSLEETIRDLVMATLPYIRPSHHPSALVTILGSLTICSLINADIDKEINMVAYRRRFGGGDVLAQMVVKSAVVFGRKTSGGRRRCQSFPLELPADAQRRGLRSCVSQSATLSLKKLASSPTWFPAGTFIDGRSVRYSTPTSYQDFVTGFLRDMKSRISKSEGQSLRNKRVTDSSPARMVMGAYQSCLRTMCRSFGVPEDKIEMEVDEFMHAVFVQAFHTCTAECMHTFSASSWKHKKMVG